MQKKSIYEISKVLTEGDIVILDIGENDHAKAELKNVYNDINNLKLQVTSCKTVLVRSAIPNSFKNTSIIDGGIITIANNSLINFYTSYGYDAFGDCAGIKRSEIENIPASSPAYVTYNQANNCYIGYKGIYNSPTTFRSMVLPNYTSSSYWLSLSNSHKNCCYGCTMINNMFQGNQSPNAPVKWKTISISHYMRSIDEII